MKLIKNFAFLLLLSLPQIIIYGQTRNDYFKEIYSQIEKNNYFKAKEIYDLRRNELSVTCQKTLEAFLDNAFNRLIKSQQDISYVLREKNSVPDSLKFRLFKIREDNFLKTYNYRGAKKTASFILKNYKNYLSLREKEDEENNLKTYSALKNAPSQKVVILQNTEIKMIKDIAGLKNLKVSANHDTLNFIFDTGANFSTTSQSVAKRLKMNIIPGLIEVNTSTGVKVKAQLAVCKQLNLGNIEIRNAVFLVLPDQSLSFPQIKYQIYGILGYPVIESFREVQITRDGNFIVPKNETVFLGNSNLSMNGLAPLICIEGKHYTFDTGADHTLLYRLFYIEHQEEIDKSYKPQKISFGGAAGRSEFEGYIIDHTFNFCGKTFNLKGIQLLKEKINDDETVYGNIGQDFILQFNKMTLNFDHMFIRLE
ncbi:MAG: retropepsin-like aspartic protease [Bacteroidota bacterium]|nr:retropepsin-like aspartic protease [Bacteroidota bacterium]